MTVLKPSELGIPLRILGNRLSSAAYSPDPLIGGYWVSVFPLAVLHVLQLEDVKNPYIDS
jgi:hypothetical protein